MNAGLERLSQWQSTDQPVYQTARNQPFRLTIATRGKFTECCSKLGIITGLLVGNAADWLQADDTALQEEANKRQRVDEGLPGNAQQLQHILHAPANPIKADFIIRQLAAAIALHFVRVGHMVGVRAGPACCCSSITCQSSMHSGHMVSLSACRMQAQ